MSPRDVCQNPDCQALCIGEFCSEECEDVVCGHGCARCGEVCAGEYCSDECELADAGHVCVLPGADPERDRCEPCIRGERADEAQHVARQNAAWAEDVLPALHTVPCPAPEAAE